MGESHNGFPWKRQTAVFGGGKIAFESRSIMFFLELLQFALKRQGSSQGSHNTPLIQQATVNPHVLIQQKDLLSLYVSENALMFCLISLQDDDVHLQLVSIL